MEGERGRREVIPFGPFLTKAVLSTKPSTTTSRGLVSISGKQTVSFPVVRMDRKLVVCPSASSVCLIEPILAKLQPTILKKNWADIFTILIKHYFYQKGLLYLSIFLDVASCFSQFFPYLPKFLTFLLIIWNPVNRILDRILHICSLCIDTLSVSLQWVDSSICWNDTKNLTLL